MGSLLVKAVSLRNTGERRGNHSPLLLKVIQQLFSCSDHFFVKKPNRRWKKKKYRDYG